MKIIKAQKLFFSTKLSWIDEAIANQKADSFTSVFKSPATCRIISYKIDSVWGREGKY